MPEKRKVTVDGEEFEVEIRPGDGNWEVCIEGRTYAVEVEGIERRAQRKRRDAKSRGSCVPAADGVCKEAGNGRGEGRGEGARRALGPATEKVVRARRAPQPRRV